MSDNCADFLARAKAARGDIGEDLEVERCTRVIARTSAIIEGCAYRLAGSVDTSTVAQLILLAAELDRLAGKLGRTGPAPGVTETP